MNRILAYSISVIVCSIMLNGCSDDNQTSADSGAGIKQGAKGLDHYYALEDGGLYGYERQPSEEEVSRGMATAPILMIRYVGKKDGKWQVANNDGGVTTVFECSNPCEFIKTMVFDDDEGPAIHVQRIRGQPGILAYNIIQDAINGKITKTVMGVRQNGKDYYVWYDEKEGMVLTPVTKKQGAD